MTDQALETSSAPRKRFSLRRRVLAVVCATAAWSWCAGLSTVQASDPASPLVAPWQAEEARDHPLAGRIFANREVAAITWGDLMARLATVPVLLLGEVHDNPDHHRLRAALIRALAAGPSARGSTHVGTLQRPPALVFEHIRADQGAGVDAFNAAATAEPRPTDGEAAVAALFEGLGWQRSGWPAKLMFAPLFRAAFDGGHPLRAGDPPRTEVRAIARGGIAALPAAEADRLRMDAPLPGALQEDLLAELAESHCGLMPSTAFAGMAVAQAYKDAHQAAALVAAARAQGRAILLAGNGHVRSDRGVPFHLQRLAPELSRLVVVFVEVDDGRRAMTDADGYFPRDPDGRAAADFVVLTPRAARPDPCAEMRRRFSKPPGK